MEDSFKACEIPVKKVLNPFGSDGSSFAKKKIPTLYILGTVTTKFDPTYHTRLDKLSNLDPEGIQCLKKVLLDFILKWDKDNTS